MTLKKNKLVLGIAVATLSVAGALAAPQALALSKAERSAEAANRKVDALEAQLRAMQDEMASIRAQTAAPHADNTAKVQELDQWMNSVKSAPVKERTKDNMVFFRGGYGHNNDVRGGTLDPTHVAALGLYDPHGVLIGPLSDQDSWYFGAGFDFSINDNLFGLMDGTEVAAELMVDYKQLGTRGQNGLSEAETAVLLAAAGIALPAANTELATVNQLTVAASPKIKFLKGSAFRPWLIPIGFELNVISPPSDAITVLNPGIQFGIGADYKIWKDIYIGADARYHLTTGTSDGVDTDGVTAGGYLGLGF